MLWLARELSTADAWKSRVIVVVSHDRHFLDACTTDSLHISGAARRLTHHRMCYSAWAAKREEQQKALGRRVTLRDEKKAKLEAYAGHGFKYGGSSSQINMMQRKANEAAKLDEEAAAEAAETADLAEDAELRSRRGLIEERSLEAVARLENVAFRYPGMTSDLFAGVDMNIDSQSRVCLLGENGDGKTTLVKVMLGKLDPAGGDDRSRREVALVNQHHADQLSYDKTPLAFMLEKFPGDGSIAHEQECRAHLASCGVLAGTAGGTVRRRSAEDNARASRSPPSRSKNRTSSCLTNRQITWTSRRWRRSRTPSRISRAGSCWCRTTSTSCNAPRGSVRRRKRRGHQGRRASTRTGKRWRDG